MIVGAASDDGTNKFQVTGTSAFHGTVSLNGHALNANTGSGSGSFLAFGRRADRLFTGRESTDQFGAASPNPGQIYFNTTTNHFFGWNGSAWKQLDN